jgi:hypothetical protein
MRRDRRAGANRRAKNISKGPRASDLSDDQRLFNAAFRLDELRSHDKARELYLRLDADGVDPGVRVQAVNNIAVLDVCEYRYDSSRNGFIRALSIDPTCECAQRNLATLESCGYGDHHDHDHYGRWRLHEGHGQAPYRTSFQVFWSHRDAPEKGGQEPRLVFVVTWRRTCRASGMP